MLGLVGFWRVNFLVTMPVATWARGAGIQFLLLSSHRLACGVHAPSLLLCPPLPCNPCYLGASAVSVQHTWARIERSWARLHQGHSLYINPLSSSLSSFLVRVFECLVGIDKHRQQDLGHSGGLVCVLEEMSVSNNVYVLRCPECQIVNFFLLPLLTPHTGWWAGNRAFPPAPSLTVLQLR